MARHLTTTIVRVVLHGGLGNQLFQYFIGILEARHFGAHSLRLNTHALGHYNAARNFELVPLIHFQSEIPRIVVHANDVVARLRIPKILHRLTKQEIVFDSPLYGRLIDGYFQHSRYFQRYPLTMVRNLCSDWRTTLLTKDLLATPTRSRITHIRLGDFFRSSEEARHFAREHLVSLRGTSDLVTDQEDLVQSAIEELRISHRFRLVGSQNLDPWSLLRLFSQYGHIETNGSSLAFWAATLAGVRFTSSNSEHQTIHALIRPDNSRTSVD